MAWLSRVNFISSDTLSFTDINNLGNDIRAWGDNVNGGGYTLSNVVLSASSGTMATVTGGTGAASTLTIRSTSGTGTSDAIVFQTASQSERMRILQNGNVGIGTSSPQGKLAISNYTIINALDGGSASSDIGNNLRFDGANWRYLNTGAASLLQFTAGDTKIFTAPSGTGGNIATLTERMQITSSGNVGIGTASPAYQLQLSTDSAAKPTTNTWTIASDARLKTVRGQYKKGLAEICALRPVRYEYNGKAGFIADGKDKVSILAQELMQVFPECIDTFKGKLEEDGPEIDLYNYNGHAITFALINAIKELKAKIDILEARN